MDRLKSLDDISKMSINDISKYIDDTFGVVSPDDCMKHDDRYYYDYDIDEATGEKMEFIERARGILLQIKHINETLNKTPDYNSRKALKQSREALYTEYKALLGGRQPKTDTGTPNPLLSNQQFQEVLQRAIQAGLVVTDENTGCYSWKGQKNQLAYFVKLSCKKFGLSKAQTPNGEIVLNCRLFADLFGVESRIITNNMNAINQTSVKKAIKDEVERLFK